MSLLEAIRRSLAVGLLLIGWVLGLQAGYLLRQISETVNAQAEALRGTAGEARATLALARSTLVEQQGYYRDSASHIKALTKAAAIDAIRLGRLIERTDASLERMTAATESALAAAQDAARSVALQTESVGEDSQQLLEAATAATQQLGQLAADDNLRQSVAHLEATTANLEAATAAAAEATGYVRDMLSPAKKSFWRRLLELMIPRPTVRVK